MGIKNLNKFLEKNCKEVFENILIDDFDNQWIAVDISIYMYQHMAVALNTICNQTNFLVEELNREAVIQLWINKTIESLMKWVAYNIKPVIVFDGQPCDEKTTILEGRRKEKDLKREKIKYLKEQLKIDPFLFPHASIIDLKNEIASLIEFSPEEKLLYFNVIKSLGFPCLQSKYEAEQLCSMLCLEGYVKAVHTKDTDVLVYGCPIMIKKFSDEVKTDEYGFTTPLLECVKIEKVLTGLKINHETFTDLCIMSGCDYNISIKRLGPCNAFKYLQKYKKIEDIPVKELQKYGKKDNIVIDPKSLNYEFCRNQFKFVESESLIDNDYKLDDLKLTPPTHDYIKYTKFYITNLKSYYQNLK
jgi:5'-3' exonuclease